jgi:hypothetical protein
MTVKRDRLPKPTDRRAKFLDAWAEPDGRLGIELNDRGTIYAVLLQVKKADLDTVVEAVGVLRQPATEPHVSADLPTARKPRRNQ